MLKEIRFLDYTKLLSAIKYEKKNDKIRLKSFQQLKIKNLFVNRL